MPNKLGHLAVNTQTPLVRLRGDVAGVSRDGVLPLDRLRRGEQYRFTAGGVTRMLLPLLERWVDEGVARDPEWFSMAAAHDLGDLDEAQDHAPVRERRRDRATGSRGPVRASFCLLYTSPSPRDS